MSRPRTGHPFPGQKGLRPDPNRYPGASTGTNRGTAHRSTKNGPCLDAPDPRGPRFSSETTSPPPDRELAVGLHEDSTTQVGLTVPLVDTGHEEGSGQDPFDSSPGRNVSGSYPTHTP